MRSKGSCFPSSGRGQDRTTIFLRVHTWSPISYVEDKYLWNFPKGYDFKAVLAWAGRARFGAFGRLKVALDYHVYKMEKLAFVHEMHSLRQPKLEECILRNKIWPLLTFYQRVKQASAVEACLYLHRPRISTKYRGDICKGDCSLEGKTNWPTSGKTEPLKYY